MREITMTGSGFFSIANTVIQCIQMKNVDEKKLDNVQIVIKQDKNNNITLDIYGED